MYNIYVLSAHQASQAHNTHRKMASKAKQQQQVDHKPVPAKTDPARFEAHEVEEIPFETSHSIPFSAHVFRKEKQGRAQFASSVGACLNCGMDIKSKYLQANECFGRRRVKEVRIVFEVREPSVDAAEAE